VGLQASLSRFRGRTRLVRALSLSLALALLLAPGAAARAQAQPEARPGDANQGVAQQGEARLGEARLSEQRQAAERVNDFPTLARVEYVFDCLSENEGPRHEMLYKCVCAVDRVAEAVSYDRWVDLSTFFRAQPMAGERGAYVRERADIQSQLKSYRELQAKVKQACFIPSGK
jgi:hypothetical protein